MISGYTIGGGITPSLYFVSGPDKALIWYKLYMINVSEPPYEHYFDISNNEDAMKDRENHDTGQQDSHCEYKGSNLFQVWEFYFTWSNGQRPDTYDTA
mgnify:CR=1 FL=1